MTQTRAITLNALSLYAVALVLAAAFAAQLVLHATATSAEGDGRNARLFLL